MYNTTIYEVARALLSIESMTPKKLQKLCYYYYSWHLALRHNEPFENRFEAWIHGPVDPQLYGVYKQFKWEDIPQPENVSDLSEEVLEFAAAVYSTYGHMNGDELEYITHREDPWLNARQGLAEYESSNNLIARDDIRSFYQRRFENVQGE